MVSMFEVYPVTLKYDFETAADSKRRRLNTVRTHRSTVEKPKVKSPIIRQLTSCDHVLENEEIWPDQHFFAVGLPDLNLEAPADFDFIDEYFQTDQARQAWDLDISTISAASSSDTESEVVTSVLFPEIPDVAHRHVNLNLLNPFSEGSVDRYMQPRAIAVTAKEGEVNGYIKFRLHNTQAGFDEPINKSGPSTFAQHHRQSPITKWKMPWAIVPLLPPNFGRGLRLDVNDQKLLTFYLTAFCQGRTLIPKHNFWLTEITPMAETEPIVQASLLALSGSYVLDYVQSESLRKRTSRHYAKAAELISEALSRPDSHAVDKSNALIASIILMEADDEVIWELRRPKTQVPNFQRGYLLAKAILDHSDPGYRYWRMEHVQYSKSWVGMSMCVAFGNMLAELMTPLLPPSPDDRNYSWLLGGTKKEVHTIYGAKGLSPKMLHVFAQITRLCAEMKESPESVIIPMAATKIMDILKDFRQRSELSEGPENVTTLLELCELDENGKVFTPDRVTELSGATWECTARIYLHCRFFRKPQSHPDVQAELQHLIGCIKRLPWDGPLLTAQSPFFPIILMAIVSHTTEDRDVARGWFEAVVSNGGRSNVPPVWHAVQLLWKWLDDDLDRTGNLSFSDNILVGQRRAWWEEMVEYLLGEVGWMSMT